jgi:chromosome segregation protein
MKIKRLEICGFKSFVDRTVLQFDHDVTGIVGPNGCGKSNIVDAIRWAMGEQSAKTLRGRGMEDVIFNGSEDRGPHGFAEVAITFDNTDGLTPPEYADYSEIQVTRRLDRSGASDYLINKTPVRLMDVTNLFLGTGVGKRAYSIIEQGRIGYIVSSKPEDRRMLLEEAAGVTKFKLRKKAAERKMDQTRQNLLRVGDIVTEIERSLASLKRQAQKAERYKKYREEMRDLELHVASHRWLELTGAHGVIRAELDEQSAGVEGVRYALRVREAELETVRADVSVAESRVEKAQTQAYELDNRARLLESQIEHQSDLIKGSQDAESAMRRELEEIGVQREMLASERAGLEASLAALEEKEKEAEQLLATETAELERRRTSATDAEHVVSEARARLSDADTRIARAETVLHGFEQRRGEAKARLERLTNQGFELEQRAQELEQEAATIRARLEGLASGKIQTANQRDEIERELEALRVQIRESDSTLESLRERLTDRRSRLRSLEEVHARFEGVGAGVKALVANQGGATEGVLGMLADRIDCPAEWTQALAGALGDKLQHVVVRDRHSALSALKFLRDQSRGRATVVAQRGVNEAVRGTVNGEPGAIGWLADLVRVEGEDEGLVRELLDGVLLVESLEAALTLRDAGIPGFEGSLERVTFVSRDGEVVHPDGAMTGGAGEEAGAHLIEVKREIRELHDVVAELDASLTVAVERHGELRMGIASRQASIEAARTEAHDAELAILAAEKDEKRAQEDARATRERAATIAHEATELAASLSRADNDEREATFEIEAAREKKAEAETSVEASAAIYQQRRHAVDEQSSRVTEVRVGTAQARERAEADRGAMERLVRSLNELEMRNERLRTNIDEGGRQQTDLLAQQATAREELGRTAQLAMDSHAALAEVREAYEEIRRTMSFHEEDLKELRSSIDGSSQRINELAVNEREMYLELVHLLEQVESKHRLDLRHVLSDYHMRELPDASIKQRISELGELIERMGEINLTAIQEFEEKNERYTYLTAQRDDLEEALRQLDRAIRQMNRESRRLFHDAFHAINERFKLVFPRMFGGGKAELKLTDPENILDSGVDIIAQPPGKRLGSLELMSGGEKALTAVSLIFAIFQYKPSPFCLLDEVDAPPRRGEHRSLLGRRAPDDRPVAVHHHHPREAHHGNCRRALRRHMETPGVSKMVSVELSEQAMRRREGPRERSESSRGGVSHDGVRGGVSHHGERGAVSHRGERGGVKPPLGPCRRPGPPP